MLTKMASGRGLQAALLSCAALLLASCGQYDLVLRNSGDDAISRVLFNSPDHQFSFAKIEAGAHEAVSIRPSRDEDFEFSFARRGKREVYKIGSFTNNVWDSMTIDVRRSGVVLIDKAGKTFPVAPQSIAH